MSRSCGVGLEDAHRGHLPAPAPGKKQAPAAHRSGEEEEEDRRQAGGPAASARVAGGVASAGEGRRLGRPAAWRPRGRGGGGGGVRGEGASPACDGSAQLRENEKKNGWGPQLAAQIEGHQIGEWDEKFGRATKMAAHLLSLLEIDFLCPPPKS